MLIEDLEKYQGDIAYIIATNPDGSDPQILAYRLINSSSNMELQEAYLMASKNAPKARMTEPDPDVQELTNQINSQMILEAPSTDKVYSIFPAKKYKPVALKTRPFFSELPSKFRILRNIKGNPLTDLPNLDPNPPSFKPIGQYTRDQMDKIDQVHKGDFLWPEERKLLHHFMMLQNQAFAWDDNERGRFREDFFPPVEMPVVEHKPWVLRNIPIPPGKYQEICAIIKKKIDAGVYEPSNLSYRSRWFCVEKKSGALRLVHALQDHITHSSGTF